MAAAMISLRSISSMERVSLVAMPCGCPFCICGARRAEPLQWWLRLGLSPKALDKRVAWLCIAGCFRSRLRACDNHDFFLG